MLFIFNYTFANWAGGESVHKSEVSLYVQDNRGKPGVFLRDDEYKLLLQLIDCKNGVAF